MWWMNFLRKVQLRWKGWRASRASCREFRLMIQLARKKMRRAIRGAQAGLRRFARFQMWLISWANLKRKDLVVPGDLSSVEKVETDGLLEEFDDLDILSLDALVNYWQWVDEQQEKKEKDQHQTASAPLDIISWHNSSDNSSADFHLPSHTRRRGTFGPKAESGGLGRGNSSGTVRSHGRKSCSSIPSPTATTKPKAEKSYHHHRHGRRSRYGQQKTDGQSPGDSREEQTSQRSAFLEFLFEDSPSPSRFLTSQALQNILGCPSCRDIVSILPTDINSSRGCRPCEQCLGYSQTGKCLLCECSYGETKSLLLEKLSMRCWLRPCRYQSFGCQSLVGTGASDDIEHIEDECKFQPLHCPFMLCRRKFPMASLIKHLHSEHHIYPHDGPKSEGTIFCLPNNKRRRGARANYTLDPCAVSCYGNIFILRILRHSTSWYIWVWAFRRDDERPQDFEQDWEQTMENFPYTITFRLPTSRIHSTNSPRDLTLSGSTVPLRLSMEEIMEQGACQVIPEQGSLFDSTEENESSQVDFKLIIHPARPSLGLKFEPKAVREMGSRRRKSQ